MCDVDNVPVTVLLLLELNESSVVRDLLALAVAGPYTTAYGSRDAYTKADCSAHDEESDDDLKPKPLLAGQALEEVAALLALVVLSLVEYSLPGWPHCAVLDFPDATVNRDLGQLLGGSS